jgi:Cu+-exporting ATPase
LGKGRKLSLLSGDNDSERRFLTNLYREWADLRFGLKPIEKAEIVEEAELSATVCMIGDGLNDTIALSKSSIGIAVTESLNDFYPGADAVLLAENFDKLGSFFELSVFSSRILRWSLVFSILYNLGGLAFAVSGNLTPVVAAILMPLSSITVVLLVALLVKYKSKQLKLI